MTTPEPVGGLRLSVVLPTYRAPELLAAALRSLAAQDVAPGMAEIIVVDDGSPGFDPFPLPELAAPLPMRSIHFERNRGRAAARNAGIESARGEVVVFLDGDMTVRPGFLSAHDAFHRQSPGCAAVGEIRWGPEIPDTALTRYFASRGVARFEPGPVPFKCFVTGNSSVPLSILHALGGFDEGLSAYGGEDLELGYRLHLHGVPVYSLPGARTLHHSWRPLAATCRAMETYGRQSLPRMVDTHPDLASILRLGFLTRGLLDPRRWLPRMALWGPLYHGVRWSAERMENAPWPSILYDYLCWAGRTRGYLQARGRDMPSRAGPEG